MAQVDDVFFVVIFVFFFLDGGKTKLLVRNVKRQMVVQVDELRFLTLE